MTAMLLNPQIMPVSAICVEGHTTVPVSGRIATLARFEWGAMSRANDPDCRVGLFCSGTEENGRHQECQLGIAGWFSGSPDEMRIYDTGDGGVLGEHSRGHRGIAYTLKCQDCGRSVTLMIPDLRDRIVAEHEHGCGELNV